MEYCSSKLVLAPEIMVVASAVWRARTVAYCLASQHQYNVLLQHIKPHLASAAAVTSTCPSTNSNN
eukprot:3933767-Rhodomonas_salina.4